MISINSDNYSISMTRGDDEIITFYALTDDGTPYKPDAGDELSFGVVKKWNGDPLFQITNTAVAFELSAEASSGTATVSSTFYDKYTLGGDYVFTYTSSAWKHNNATVALADYGITYTGTATEGTTITVTLDDGGFWDIHIKPEHTAELKSMTYYYDVQIDDGEIHTIIGKTDSIEPTLTIWGEASE